MMVGKPSPNRREDELHGGERGDDGADDPAARAVMPAEDRHQRHDDAESNEVNEDRQENNEQRWFAVHVQINAVSLATKTGESNLLAAAIQKLGKHSTFGTREKAAEGRRSPRRWRVCR